MALVEYGITTSVADFWVHVCPKAGHLYFYHRGMMLDWLREHAEPVEHENRPIVYLHPMKKIRSAAGWPVPADLEFVKASPIPEAIARTDWDVAGTDRAVGAYAEDLIWDYFSLGYMSPWSRLEYVKDVDEQRKGYDFIMRHENGWTLKLEVKADVRGGLGENCTGNLFVQYAEGGHQHQKRLDHLNGGSNGSGQGSVGDSEDGTAV